MEYEVFYGCNLVGTLVVVLIIVYHLIGAREIKSLSENDPCVDLHVSLKKSQ